MTIVNSLDRIAVWLEENVCLKVELKPHSLGTQTANFEYELVHPHVFPLYVPAPSNTHKAPKQKSTTPSICVQIFEGNDDLAVRERRVKYLLSFSAWDPGLHGPDILTPTGKTDEVGPEYERGENGTFTLSHGGWRDVWNFVDTALREIENARSIAGYILDPKAGIKFGSFDEDGAIADYYPFWFAWVELTTIQQVITDNPALDDLL